MELQDLQGKTALVTGGANGIGAGVARRLASHGVQVVVADIADDAGRQVAAAIGGHFVHCDVSRLEDNEAAVAEARQRFGALHICFLNAGVSTGCGIGEDFDPALYRRAMGVNLDGVVFGVHAALPALRAAGGGDIVATASLAGLVAVAFDPVYGANKHGVVGLTRSLGLVLAGDGVRVNAICPGFADTAIVDGIRGALEQAGVPLIEVDRVVDAFMAALTSGDSGQCWFVQPGRPSEPFRFRNVPGPRGEGEGRRPQ